MLKNEMKTENIKFSITKCDTNLKQNYYNKVMC